MSDETCAHCGESLKLCETEPAADQRMLGVRLVPSISAEGTSIIGFHGVCLFRGIAGSVAHQEGRCGCFVPGASDGDPEGLTKLEAAEAALAVFRRRRRQTGGAI